MKTLFVLIGAAACICSPAKASNIEQQVDTIATGRVYEFRKGDLAWENDLVAFRAYGPALQATGEKGYGYDIFTKRDTNRPILDDLYALERDNTWRAEHKALVEAGEKAKADSMMLAHSYHVDQGHGMDCFAVGATLGAGCTALLVNDSIVYPWCYQTCEILENGPLRFRARLTFEPKLIAGQMVTEIRDITLDAGEYLNHTVITYQGLETPLPIIAGFPLRDDGEICIDDDKRYIAYINPTLKMFPDLIDDQGKIFQGIILAQKADSITVRTDDGVRHLVATSTYVPEQRYEYYWGFAWDRAGVTWQQWLDYLASVKTLTGSQRED